MQKCVHGGAWCWHSRNEAASEQSGTRRCVSVTPWSNWENSKTPVTGPWPATLPPGGLSAARLQYQEKEIAEYLLDAW